MEFQSLSLLAGTRVCNAACPFCVSKLTGMRELGAKPEPINQRNMHKAFRLAQIGNVTSVIITGKGEPLLFPEHIDLYMENIGKYDFPFIELQTNAGILAHDEYRGRQITHLLKKWQAYGMTTILISNVGYDPELNRQIYFPKMKEYIDLPTIIKKIQDCGLNVRLTTVGIKGGIDNIDRLHKMMEFADKCNVKQLTWRPVAKPLEKNSQDVDGFEWVKANGLAIEDIECLNNYVKSVGTLLYKLVHGAAVYDFQGHNLCMTNCLTHDPEEKIVRQLIFFPNGGLFTDWQFKGSILL